jgi:hypothetical protein
LIKNLKMGSVEGHEKIPSEQGKGLEAMEWRKEPRSSKRSLMVSMQAIHSNVEWSWQKESMVEGPVEDVEVVVGERRVVVELGLEEVEEVGGVRWSLRKRRKWPWWVRVVKESESGEHDGRGWRSAGERGLGLERVLVVVVVSIIREIWVSGAS